MNQLFDNIPLWITSSCQPIFFDNQPGINFKKKNRNDTDSLSVWGSRRGFPGKNIYPAVIKKLNNRWSQHWSIPFSHILCFVCVSSYREDYQGWWENLGWEQANNLKRVGRQTEGKWSVSRRIAIQYECINFTAAQLPYREGAERRPE
jgi:hypothetical protein